MSKGMLRQAHNRKQLELFQNEVSNILRRAICQNTVRQYDSSFAIGFEKIPNALYKEDLRTLILTRLRFPFFVISIAEVIIGKIRFFCEIDR